MTRTLARALRAERDRARAVVDMESKTASSTPSLRNKIHKAFSDFSARNIETTRGRPGDKANGNPSSSFSTSVLSELWSINCT